MPEFVDMRDQVHDGRQVFLIKCISKSNSVLYYDGPLCTSPESPSKVVEPISQTIPTRGTHCSRSGIIAWFDLLHCAVEP